MSIAIEFLERVSWIGLFIGAIRIIVVLFIAFVFWLLSQQFTKQLTKLLQRRAKDNKEAAKRAQTVSNIVQHVLSALIGLIALLMVMDELGYPLGPVLAAAGVVGLAVSFAAQSLIRDYLNGFVILIENQIRIGDVVRVAGTAGLVEDVTLRYVRLRDLEGAVHFIPNGQITEVTNMTLDLSRAVIDVGIAYRSDIDKALEIMRRVGEAMCEDEQFRHRISGQMEIFGVNELSDSAVILRGRIQTLPAEQWNVQREYLRRIKLAFDREGIEIPFPHRTLYWGEGQPPLSFMEAHRAAQQGQITEEQDIATNSART